MDDYTVTPRTRVRRQHTRGHYDRETVYAILDAGLLCHVAFIHDGKPAIVPTAQWRHGDTLYFHGSSASRMLRSVAGHDVSVAVSLMDGLVLARSGFHHSINYRSVIVYGVAEKLQALEGFMERITPGRWAECRPVTDKELRATTVLRVPLDEVSAKIRTGPPKDDEPDYDDDIWAGVGALRDHKGHPGPRPAAETWHPASALSEVMPGGRSC